jgi:peptide/nickel transport system permease protein
MNRGADVVLIQEGTVRARPQLRGSLRFVRTKPMGAISVVLLVAMIVAAIFAPIVAPYGPLRTHAAAPFASPNSHFLLGTDNLGRDTLSRIIYGARVSLKVGMIVVVTSLFIGVLVGLLSGYVEGWPDMVLQRIADIFMAFPGIILALAVMSVMGIGITSVIVALTVTSWPGNSRVVRGAVLSVKSSAYIDAARALGAHDVRIVVSHVLPNVAAPIIILGTVALGNVILAEAALSFLGLGIPPPTPSWGGDLSGAGRQYFQTVPWLAICPGVAISLAVLAFNLFGDALRDTWDPRLRRSR